MRKEYALFDFDGTLIRGDSIVLFCFYAYRQGLCDTRALWRGIWAYVRYFLNLSTAEESKMATLSFLQGRDQAELRQLSEKFCEEILCPRLRPRGAQELEARQREGMTALLITASPSFYLEPLMGVLGIEGIIGTRMDFGSDGKATGLICGENCKGLQKPLRLAEYLAATSGSLDYEQSYAYGDSASDMPMLELCGHKIGVNAKPGLRKQLKRAEGASFVRW